MSGVEPVSRSYSEGRVIMRFAWRVAALSLAALAETTDLMSLSSFDLVRPRAGAR